MELSSWENKNTTQSYGLLSKTCNTWSRSLVIQTLYVSNLIWAIVFALSYLSQLHGKFSLLKAFQL